MSFALTHLRRYGTGEQEERRWGILGAFLWRSLADDEREMFLTLPPRAFMCLVANKNDVVGATTTARW